MEIDRLKNTTILLGTAGVIGLVALISRRPIKQPVLEDFQNSVECKASLPSIGAVLLYDFDSDRQVDAVINEQGWITHIVKGYEEEASRYGGLNPERVNDLTPGMREQASKIMRGSQDLGYEMAKNRYEEQSK